MVHKYWVLLRMKFIEMFAYQLATLFWMTGAMVQPLITMVVWMDIYEAKAESFILYFASLILVERLTSAWDVWELDREIREGGFSHQILRPLHPVHWAIAENLVYKGFFLAILLPIWILLSFFLPVLRLHLSGSQWIFFLLAVLLGAALRFTFGYMCGLLGFWVTKVTAIYGMFEAVSLFFSGRIAPLSLLPPFMQQISLFLPFRYMIGFPIEIVTGSVTGMEIGYGFLGSALWMLVFIVGFKGLWKVGLQKNQAMGG